MSKSQSEGQWSLSSLNSLSSIRYGWLQVPGKQRRQTYYLGYLLGGPASLVATIRRPWLVKASEIDLTNGYPQVQNHSWVSGTMSYMGAPFFSLWTAFISTFQADWLSPLEIGPTGSILIFQEWKLGCRECKSKGWNRRCVLLLGQQRAVKTELCLSWAICLLFLYLWHAPN